MKQVINTVVIEFKFVQDYEGEEGLISPEEHAENVAYFVCDEYANVGVASYEILSAKREIK